MEDGRLIRHLLDPINAYLDSRAHDERLTKFVEPLKTATIQLDRATTHILQAGRNAPAEIGSAATPYLRLLGITALAYLWARMAETGLAGSHGTEAEFYRAKVKTARFFIEHLLPQTHGLTASVLAGASSLMDFDDEAW